MISKVHRRNFSATNQGFLEKSTRAQRLKEAGRKNESSQEGK